MASPKGGPARGSAIRTFLIADIRGYTRVTAGHGDEPCGGDLVELRGDGPCSTRLNLAAPMSRPEAR